MAKNERKRTMVYSNVSKKADKKSASKNNDIINLDNEVVIGLTCLPKEKQVVKKNTKGKKKKNNKLKEKEKVDYNLLFREDNKKDYNKKNKINKQEEGSKNLEKFNGQAKNSTKTITIQQKIKIQKRKAIKKMATFFLLLILLIGAFIYFLLSPIFNVKTIEVINNKYISSEQIINLSKININENMFKFSKKEAKKSIISNAYIENVDITRKVFSNKIQINVKERNATLMLEYGNSYVYINNQGYILEISPIKLDAPILKGYVTPLEQVKPGNRLNKDDLERLKTVLNIIETANSQEISNLITQIDIQSKKDYKLILETEEKVVYLGDCSDLSTQMLYVKEMLEREKGVEGEFFVNMDLNTNNPVFREKV